MPLSDALNLSRQKGVDLVEIAPNATPPVCRLVEYGKYKYEQEKRQKESRKHQHANKVKEIQLSANIDPHDFQTKVSHAIGFLCEDMKVKASLRFRGREMAHTEFGFGVVKKFLAEISPWGHQDFDAKLTGRSINVMISPLPRAKRAKHPDELKDGTMPPKAPGSGAAEEGVAAVPDEAGEVPAPIPSAAAPAPVAKTASKPPAGNPPGGAAAPQQGKGPGFANNPFERLDIAAGN